MDKHLKLSLGAKLDDNLNLVSYSAKSSSPGNIVGANYGHDNLAELKQELANYNTNYIGDKITSSDNTKYQTQLSSWHWWEDYYYPRVIKESYPVYIQEKALDKGKQAYEIIKMMKDKRFVKLDTGADFIEIMDALIKIL